MRRKLQKNRNKIQNLIPCPCLKRWVFAMVYLCHIYFNVLNFVVLMYNSKSNRMCMWFKSASDGNYSLEMRYQQFRRALISNLDSRCEVYFPVFCAFRKFKNIKCFETYFLWPMILQWQISFHTFCFKYISRPLASQLELRSVFRLDLKHCQFSKLGQSIWI